MISSFCSLGSKRPRSVFPDAVGPTKAKRGALMAGVWRGGAARFVRGTVKDPMSVAIDKIDIGSRIFAVCPFLVVGTRRKKMIIAPRTAVPFRQLYRWI